MNVTGELLEGTFGGIFDIEMIAQDLGLWAYFLLAIMVLVEGPIATLAGAIAASSGLMKPKGYSLRLPLVISLLICSGTPWVTWEN